MKEFFGSAEVILALLAALVMFAALAIARRRKGRPDFALAENERAAQKNVAAAERLAPREDFNIVQVGIVAVRGEWRIVDREESRTGVRLVSIPVDLLTRYERALREWSAVQHTLARFPTSLRPRKPRAIEARAPRASTEVTVDRTISAEALGLRRNDEPDAERIIENSGPLIPDDVEGPLWTRRAETSEDYESGSHPDSSLEDVPPTPLEQAIEEAHSQTDGAPTSAEGGE